MFDLYYGVNDSSINTLVKNLPHLASLHVGYSKRISDETGKHIGKNLPRLELLSLSSHKMFDSSCQEAQEANFT